ncbi:bifunctional phosphopantothenoylcysteine decarboxylase/phosphopantothenate--cysteine ligase CoaBC [Acidithiobacillus sp. AMEEHan]|uniref:bifunctional phosphopantothenoylcysteine decarboxylase/phosphopantothenate--cysteine ligase CoaBC n=1 Tax=Acidithiobacillus sp. AMEEHan TaxID=2994951 RepID=UPI0027E42AD1|nr:bifunctional phosphopantothenoylcysteine decarboxylase/phosphopantothenate--cysteine ligase CoaBC [Acidithiobacillus sp. AMEEHan]
MDPLAGKKILLLIGGSIAAYKTPELVRLLRAAGAELRIALSPHASDFVSPLALQAVSGQVPRLSLFSPAEEAAMDHIALARWADALLYAPVSAAGLARLAQGLAEDLPGAIVLASRAPLFLAPAMNTAMWEHPATQRNLQQLAAYGAQILEPESGSLACGETGTGRLQELSSIVEHLRLALAPHPWSGWRVLVTAGPTWEAWDPVRGLSNRASGRQGYALAQAAAERGAQVTLVSGPTALSCPAGIQRVEVESAREMLVACQDLLRTETINLFIANAAVADHRPATVLSSKQGKQELPPQLQLVANPDIVHSLHRDPRRPRWILAFAAETHGDEGRAVTKLHAKGADFAAINDLRKGAMGGEENAVVLFCQGQRYALAPQAKLDLARALLHHLDTCLHGST